MMHFKKGIFTLKRYDTKEKFIATTLKQMRQMLEDAEKICDKKGDRAVICHLVHSCVLLINDMEA